MTGPFPLKDMLCGVCNQTFKGKALRKCKDKLKRCYYCYALYQLTRRANRYADPNEFNVYLKNKYKITLHEYTTREADQNGVCKICKLPQLTPGKRLSVDHCHKTQKVRGLLCDNCNHMLGSGQDNPIILMEGAKYILSMSK